METVKANAKAKKIPRRNSQQNGEDDGQRLEASGGCSPIHRLGQSNGATSGDCEERNSNNSTSASREEINNGSDTGKILEEVLLLKQQFLDYIKSDQSRLETRLDESKKQEQQFLSNTEAIEKRLRAALAIEYTPEESENNNE